MPSSYPEPSFVIRSEVPELPPPICARRLDTKPVELVLFCLTCDPTCITEPEPPTIDEFNPTVTLFENVSIGFGANLFLAALVPKSGL